MVTHIACIDRTMLLKLEDGLLSASEAEAVANHLSSCAHCRALAAELDELGEAALRFADTRAAGACPDAMTLAAYTEGRLGGRELAECEAHLAACGHCTADLAALGRELAGLEVEPGVKTPAWALARAQGLVEARTAVVDARAEARDEARVEARASQASGGRGWMVFARLRAGSWTMAAMAATAIILLAQLPPPGAVGPAVRGSRPTPTIVLNSPIDGANLTAVRGILSWQAIPGAGSYHVTLVDASGNPVWEAETTSTQIAIPATLPLTAGAPYSWWVKTLLDSGEEVESPIGRFTVSSN